MWKLIRSLGPTRRGRRALKSRNWAGARESFEAAVALAPRNQQAWRGLSLAAFGQQDYARCLDALWALQKAKPLSLLQEALRLKAYLGLEAWAEVSKQLRAVPELEATSTGRQAAIEAALATNQAADVMKRVDAWVDAEPDNPQAHFMHGKVRLQAGQLALARGAFEAAISLQEDFWAAWEGWFDSKTADSFEEQDADLMWNKMQEQPNLPPEAYRVWGRLAVRGLQGTKLTERVSLLLTQGATYPELFFLLGEGFLLRSNLSDAQAAFTKAIALLGTYGDAYAERALVKALKGDLPGVWTDLERAEAFAASPERVARAKAAALWAADQPGPALQVLQEQPKSRLPWVHYYRGLLHAELGQAAEAIEALHLAAEWGERPAAQALRERYGIEL